MSGQSIDGSQAPWPTRLTGLDLEFLTRCHTVMDLGAGLHELAALAQVQVAHRDGLGADLVAADTHAGKAVADEVRNTLSAQMETLIGAFSAQLDDRLDGVDPAALSEVADPFEWVAGFLDPTSQGAMLIAEASAGVGADDPDAVLYLGQYGHAWTRRPRLPLLQRALLITAVASAETVIGGVVRRLLFDRHGPERWGPWADSKLLDDDVRRVLGRGVRDWQTNLQAEFGLALQAATCDWPAVAEVFARRNVLVHNGGVVDSRYIQNVPGAPSLGAILTVKDDYLRDAIDLLCGLLLGLITGAWQSAAPDRRAFVCALVCWYAGAATSERRWPLAENLQALAARLDDDPVDSATHQVNAWIARVRRLGSASVVADATVWSTNGLPARFGLAKLILQGRHDDAMIELPKIVATGEVDRDDLSTWPLFDPLRERPDFQGMLGD